jgi:hypothetical protein
LFVFSARLPGKAPAISNNNDQLDQQQQLTNGSQVWDFIQHVKQMLNAAVPFISV